MNQDLQGKQGKLSLKSVFVPKSCEQEKNLLRGLTGMWPVK
jgi:hypothetical protein